MSSRSCLLPAAGILALGKVGLSGVVCGAARVAWGIVIGHRLMGWRIVVATGSLAIAFAVVNLVGGRGLAPVIISHFLITATIQPGMIFARFAGQQPEPGIWPRRCAGLDRNRASEVDRE